MRYLALLIVSAVPSILSPVVPLAAAQSVRVTGIPQLDCPVVIEQQENGTDGSLKTADFKNFSKKTVDSIRIGWIADSGERAKPSEAVLGTSTKLGPGLTPKGQVTVPAEELGLARATTGRLRFYVASGYFSDGTGFVCSAKSIRRPRAENGPVVVARAVR
jgi:hypothetical protein